MKKEREKLREKIYHRREHQALGKSIDHSDELPAFIKQESFRFGLSSLQDDSVKHIMYPKPKKPHPDDEKFRKQYLISHWSYDPGEVRKHYGDFAVPEHKLLPDTHDNNGLRVKEVLQWREEELKDLHSKIVSKRHTEWRARRQPEIGKVHDPLKETMAHLPQDHTFGIKYLSDEYNIGDLLGSGAKACDDNLRVQEQEDRARATIGRRAALAAARNEKHTDKITSLPYESDKSEKYANQFIFGLPTVLRSRPGFVKKLADNNNYGDELDAKCGLLASVSLLSTSPPPALVSPTPENLYGRECLDRFITNSDDPVERTASCVKLAPAKVQAVRTK
ncbi:hypothetical protein HDU82_000844 [Entophlyctis luteolus]|nr:hypothetical protein HDU82_000844 [Entophlyctis luteolus]